MCSFRVLLGQQHHHWWQHSCGGTGWWRVAPACWPCFQSSFLKTLFLWFSRSLFFISMILEFRDLWSLVSAPACWRYCSVWHIACLHRTRAERTVFAPSEFRLEGWQIRKCKDVETVKHFEFTSLESTDWPGQVQRDLRPRCFCVWSHQDLPATSKSSLCQVFSTWSIPHWFAMGTSELARNPFDNGRFTNCWNFWCQPRWPAARGLLLCHAMRSQPMFACHKAAVCHKCILYASAGMHLTHAFYGLDMSHMSRTVMYLSAAQSCDAYWPTELVMFSVKFKSFGFFWKYLKIGYHPKEHTVNNIIFLWPWPFGVSPLSDSPIWGQHFSVRQSGQDSCVDSLSADQFEPYYM